MNDLTQKSIFDKEELRKQNKRTSAPKRQRPKAKSNFQLLKEVQ